MMNETPVLIQPTFDSKESLVGMGAELGMMIAIRLAGLYIVGIFCFLFFISLMNPTSYYLGDLRDFNTVFDSIGRNYFNLLLIATMMMIVGGVPAAIIGAISGGLIGYTFRFFRTPLSIKQVMLYGFFVSFLLLTIRILLPFLFNEYVWKGSFSLIHMLQADLRNSGLWFIWFAPNIIAFFGLWWVTVKINQSRLSPKIVE